MTQQVDQALRLAGRIATTPDSYLAKLPAPLVDEVLEQLREARYHLTALASQLIDAEAKMLKALGVRQ